MTLLSVCARVARVIPVPIPTVIVGSTDPTASLLYGFIQEEAEELYRRTDWTCLQKEHTFTTVNGTASYVLPTDFDHLIDGTLWDRTNYWSLRGPMSPQDWQLYKSSILGGSIGIRKRFRISAVAGVNKFRLDPTPTDASDMVFEYVSNAWCQSSLGVAQSAWAADTDVLWPDANGQFTEYLLRSGVLWRMLERNGLAYDEAKNAHDTRVKLAMVRDGGAPRLRLTPASGLRFIDTRNVPDGNWG